jgi:hypothetical protein
VSFSPFRTVTAKLCDQAKTHELVYIRYRVTWVWGGYWCEHYYTVRNTTVRCTYYSTVRLLQWVGRAESTETPSFVNTSEDRQKGESRNVTRTNTNVNSDSVSVSLYHSLNWYGRHPSSSDASSLQSRQRTSDVLYFATAYTKAILPDSSASSSVTFFAKSFFTKK